jgi:general secretion pathway protein F/type IV pilus assembly protein PilC
MIYSYKGYNTATKQKCSGKIEATTLQEAKHKLKSSSIVYSALKEEKKSILKETLRKKYTIKNTHLANLSKELAIYMQSGMSIVLAIKLAKNYYENSKKMSLFLSTIEESLEEGKSFYTALVSQSVYDIPEFYTQSIKVSESSGILADVLLELSRFLQESEKISKDVQSALAYPLFIFTVSLMMLIFMLTYVVPQMSGMFANMDQELPFSTQIVISTAEFVSSHIYTIAISLVALLISLVLSYRYISGFRYIVDRLLLRVPFLGKIVLQNELGRFAYISSLLLRSSISVVQSIRLSADTMNNSYLQSIISDSSKKVVEGQKLYNSLKSSGFNIENSFLNSIALGEETSQLESTLSSLSNFYIEKNRESIKIFISLLEPMLMLIVGGMVGFIVVSMLLPIFSISIS